MLAKDTRTATNVLRITDVGGVIWGLQRDSGPAWKGLTMLRTTSCAPASSGILRSALVRWRNDAA